MTTSFSHPLNIQSKTWLSDSYGLYDYKTTNLIKQNFTETDPCHLVRTNNRISLARIGQKESPANENEVPIDLVKIDNVEEGIRITSVDVDNGESNGLWSVMKSGIFDQGYKLKQNDVIKIGRCTLKIVQIKGADENSEVYSASPSQGRSKESQNFQGNMSTFSGLCKVCLSGQEDYDNPLICACNCTGDEKYIHLQCLQNMVTNKVVKQFGKSVITIQWNSLSCEACKQKYPVNVKHKGQELPLVQMGRKIWDSYVLVEFYSRDNDLVCMYLIDLSTKQRLKIGRADDADIKADDISISRVHSLLVVSGGNLYLHDNLSKFGTLVLQRNPIIVNEEIPETQWIQCGRTIFKFSLKRPWLAGIPCIGSLFGTNKTVKIEDKLLGGS